MDINEQASLRREVGQLKRDVSSLRSKSHSSDGFMVFLVCMAVLFSWVWAADKIDEGFKHAERATVTCVKSGGTIVYSAFALHTKCIHVTAPR